MGKSINKNSKNNSFRRKSIKKRRFRQKNKTKKGGGCTTNDVIILFNGDGYDTVRYYKTSPTPGGVEFVGELPNFTVAERKKKDRENNLGSTEICVDIGGEEKQVWVGNRHTTSLLKLMMSELITPEVLQIKKEYYNEKTRTDKINAQRKIESEKPLEKGTPEYIAREAEIKKYTDEVKGFRDELESYSENPWTRHPTQKFGAYFNDRKDKDELIRIFKLGFPKHEFLPNASEDDKKKGEEKEAKFLNPTINITPPSKEFVHHRLENEYNAMKTKLLTEFGKIFDKLHF